MVGTILSASKDFEDRFALVETKLPALEAVRRATMEKIGRFTKQDIRELCPSISISSIEGALRKLVASGELKREGAGKKICYYRSVSYTHLKSTITQVQKKRNIKFIKN